MQPQTHTERPANWLIKIEKQTEKLKKRKKSEKQTASKRSVELRHPQEEQEEVYKKVFFLL